MTHLLRAASVLALLTAAACTTTPEPSWPDGAPASAARFQSHVEALAGDDYEGREAGTPGYDKAVAYVTERFGALGVRPAGDEGYLQQVPLRRSVVSYEGGTTLSFAGPDGETRDLDPFADFLMMAPAAADPSAVSATVGITDQPLAFVGYGVDAPTLGVDSYGDLDVAGKVVLMMQGRPEGLPSEEGAHWASPSARIEAAVRRGATGVLFVVDSETDERAVAMRQGFAARPSDTFAGAAPEREGVPVAYVFREAVEAMLEASGLDTDAVLADPEASDLDGTVAMSVAATFENYESPNVAGLIEGSDPALRDEVVVLSAHLDHVGIHGDEDEEDRIHNGAMDNATGIATLLEVAQRFQDGERPKRSVMLLAVTAEEKGLLGSDHFARTPTVDRRDIVANVNLDMPVLLYDFQDVIAFGAEHSTLKGLVAEAAGGMDVALTPDPYPEMVLFVRSDHSSFVKQGVPSVFLFLGTENGGTEAFQSFMATHYHRVSDQPDLPILYDVAAKFAELNYRIAREIADADERPAWNEGDFFGEMGPDEPGV